MRYYHEDWQPASLSELTKLVDDGIDRLDSDHRQFWNTIRITPAKWTQHPWGDDGGGFWVVATIWSTAIWYNDIEDGFNTSRFRNPGHIDEYWCNDLELNQLVHQLRAWIVDEVPMPAKLGPPQPMSDEWTQGGE